MYNENEFRPFEKGKHAVRKTLLVTGGAGFVGSRLALHLKKRKEYGRVICLDNLKRRGSEHNVTILESHGITFVHGDVRNRDDLCLADEKIHEIIECSAEPSVLAGYKESPRYVIDTNLGGAINCLDVAREHNSRFVFLSTSRVYPYDILASLQLQETTTRLELTGCDTIAGVSAEGVTEAFPLEGVRSIYGATKLSAEHFVTEYGETYGVPWVINRCGVIAGPGQMGRQDQGVAAFWTGAHYFQKPLRYIGFGGTGKQVRDMVHIDDFCRLVDRQLAEFHRCSGRVFNVGGGRAGSLSLREMTDLCSEITGRTVAIQGASENRHADIPWYVADNSRVTQAVGWKPTKDPRRIIEDIHEWIRDNQAVLKPHFM